MASSESRVRVRYFSLSYFLPLILIIGAIIIGLFLTMPALTMNSVGMVLFAGIIAIIWLWIFGSVWRRAKVELISLMKGGRRVIFREGYVDIPVHLFSRGIKLLQKNPNLINYRFQYANIEYVSWLVVGLGGDMTAEVTIVLTNGKEFHLNPNNISDRRRFLSKLVQYGNVQVITHTPSMPTPDLPS